MENNELNERVNITASLEDYLEAIYQIIEEKKGVKAVEVSRRLGVGRSSVTEALKALASKNLVNYGRYDVISLTALGEKIAQKVILKHQVLHTFLTDILCIPSDEAHENACRIEHVISESVLKRFIKFIQFNQNVYKNNKQYMEELNFYLKDQ